MTALPDGHTLPGRSLQQFQLCIVVDGAEVLDILQSPWEGCTICTAVEPDAVFTVRTGTPGRYDLGLVRKFTH